MMSQVVIGEQCDCPEDCDSVTYTKFETSKDLNAEELCSDTTSWVYKHMKNTKRNVEGHAYRLIFSLIKICFQVMAIQVVVFSSGWYKIKKIFAQEPMYVLKGNY